MSWRGQVKKQQSQPAREGGGWLWRRMGRWVAMARRYTVARVKWGGYRVSAAGLPGIERNPCKAGIWCASAQTHEPRADR